MNYQKLINTNIKALRQEHHLTQEEFAEKIGISIQGLSNIERNRYQPTAETVDKICSAFEITPAQLLVTKNKTNEDTINNIVTLLGVCPPKKLKKIYDIITIILR
ncbi:MAG: helix-turn-helix transcriptional regulator [Fusobacterium sp.]|nr:helix-turn-helix transcriptional regulator [Fusobacterium sp.]